MQVPAAKALFQKGFAKTARLLLKATFHELYWDLESALAPEALKSHDEGLCFYSNHSSWWDVLVAADISVNHFKLAVMAPMSEVEFKKNPALKYTGIFGVSEGDGPALEEGLKKELFTSHKALWITPQGRFSPNESSLPAFKTGLSRWTKGRGAKRFPVAIHYSFSFHKRPSVFVRIGASVPFKAKASVDQDAETLRKALAQEVKALVRRKAKFEEEYPEPIYSELFQRTFV